MNFCLTQNRSVYHFRTKVVSLFIVVLSLSFVGVAQVNCSHFCLFCSQKLKC